MTGYQHGKRVTKEVWELSSLDLSIRQYENRCKNYYYKKRKALPESPEERSLRLQELKDAREYLDREKARIMNLIQVEERIEQYRNEFKSLPGTTSEERRAKLAKYKEEEHHPTDVLEENLRLVGRAQPGPRFTAHHIVQGKGKLPITKTARLLLFRYDIRINDSDNGVWMPMREKDKGHWAMPHAVPHSRIHTHNYERWVYGQIQTLRSEVEIRARLAIVRGHLKNGTQPDPVTQKPDPKWNGRT